MTKEELIEICEIAKKHATKKFTDAYIKNNTDTANAYYTASALLDSVLSALEQ